MFLFSLFSPMSTRKFEGRREKGIEGMSWGNDNKVGSTAPHLWTKTVLNLSIPLVSHFSLPFPSVLQVSLSYYLFFPSPSAVTRSQMKEHSLEFLNSEIQNLKNFHFFEFIEIQKFLYSEISKFQDFSM